jgi:hypothetical protein
MTPIAALLADLVTVELDSDFSQQARGGPWFRLVVGALNGEGGIADTDSWSREGAEDEAQSVRVGVAAILRRHPEALRELLGGHVAARAPLPRTRIGLMHSLAEAQLALDRAAEIAKVVAQDHAARLDAFYDGLLEAQDDLIRDVTAEEHAAALDASEALLARHDQLTAGWPKEGA